MQEEHYGATASHASKTQKLPSILFFLIAIFVLGLGLLTGILLKNNVTQPSIQPIQIATAPTKMPSPPIVHSSIDMVVQAYYQQHIACLKTYFAHPKGTPQQACPYNQTNTLTATLETKLQQVRGYNAVLCTQTIPQDILYEKAVINGSHATKNVQIKLSQISKQNVRLGLDLENNQWKISSVTCPIK